MTDYVTSYYAATQSPQPPPQPALQREIEADVCVIGGGITGCSTALNLAEKGYSVCLLEAKRIGWGASGRSGGQIIPGLAADMGRLAAHGGRDAVHRLWDMSVQAVELVRYRVEKHRIDCNLKWGYLHAAVKQRQLRELAEWQTTLENEYGYEGLTLLGDKDEVRREVDSAMYVGGLHEKGAGHLHPLNYTRGLGAAALGAGVRIYENSGVRAIKRGERVRAVTAHGSVSASHVVIAGNAYLQDLVPSIRSRIMPVGTYIIATEPLGEERARGLITNDIAVADQNFVLDYYRLSADHRMLFGGKVSYTAREPRNLRRVMRARMRKVFPQLRDAAVDYAWGGYVGITINRAPHFGTLDKNILFAQGFSGHGMALTGMAGKLMAEAVAGRTQGFDVFAGISHRRFPGGRLLRAPALVMATLYYRLRDLF